MQHLENPQDTRHVRAACDHGPILRISLRPKQAPCQTFKTVTLPAHTAPSKAEQAIGENLERNNIPAMSTVKECFDAHRFLLLALVRSASEKEEAPAGGAAVLIRVVHPAGVGPTEQACGQRALEQIAVLAIDPLATLSAPHPLHESLMRWAPIPHANQHQRSGQERIELDQRSIVHLCFAPRIPGEPILVLSFNEAGQFASHMYFQSQWSRCERVEIVTDALRHAHIQASGHPVPSTHEDLCDLHDRLRVRALAERAAAITMGTTQPHEPHISAAAPGHDAVPGLLPCATPLEIAQGFSSVLVVAALRERVRHHERRHDSMGYWI